jgi:dihydrolipoamide dehydrogenase
MHEGVHCAEHIAGFAAPQIAAPIPGCTYSTPQIASIGLTEAAAKARGLAVKVGRFPFRANGKAIAAGETEGFVKTVFDAQTGALIGAHMIGGEVTEQIQGFALAMTLEATEEDLFATVFPHPTMSEAMHEASLDAYRRVLHI